MEQDQDKQVEKKPTHYRRVRYVGTHPVRFAEKYKELNPEEYPEEVAHVISRGRTPAGMHLPICVQEILDILRVQPGQRGLDATLGWGGHARELLARIQPGGCLYATDVDAIQLPRTRDRLERLGYGPEALQTRLMNFSGIDRITAEAGPLHFVLADLGVSSMQIDNPQRGFSFKQDGPLDLRLNPQEGRPASERLRGMSALELEGMLRENADEPYAGPLARGITAAMKKGPRITTTGQLQGVISDVLKGMQGVKQEDIKKSCQRCFQALRIDVNGEFEALAEFLEKLPDALVPGGRVAILSFHSGEDRLVKKSFKRFLREGLYSEIAPDPIRPSAGERHANSRARSAKLRWAERA